MKPKQKKSVSQEVFNALVREIVYLPMFSVKDRLESLFENYAVLAPTEMNLSLLKEEQGPLDPNGHFTVVRTYMRTR